MDETYIGGKARNMHKDKRALKITGTGGMGKIAVMGLLERHCGDDEDGCSTVKAKVVPNVKRQTLAPEVREHVELGSEVFTDALKSYDALGAEYVHLDRERGVCYVKHDKEEGGGEAGRGDPDPPSPSLPAPRSSERFVDFARKIVAVPKQERITKASGSPGRERAVSLP